MKRPWVFLLGVIVGVASIIVGLVTFVPAVRRSRDPNTALGKIRTMLPARFVYRPPPTMPPESEQEYLLRRYGPDKQTPGFEEWIVRDFFQDKRGGVFVDVGAADWRLNSNTWFLETKLGWSGVAVDAQEQYRRDWERYRPKSRFLTFFVSDSSDKRVRLLLTMDPSVSSSQDRWTDRFGAHFDSIEVPSITLNDLLGFLHVTTFDFLSMDIELAEPKALAGFDIERFKPALVCVEAQAEVRQQILDYFSVHRYRVVGKYLRIDALNLWFVPQGVNSEPFPLQMDSQR